MSEINTVRSNGTLQLISGKKFRGELVAGETGAAFYAKGQKEPMAEWHEPDGQHPPRRHVQPGDRNPQG